MTLTKKKVTPKQFVKAIQLIDKLIALGEDDLARTEEVDAVKIGAQILLENYLDSDSILGREYEKWSKGTRWHDLTRDGFAPKSKIEELKVIKSFILRAMKGGKAQSSKHRVIQKGHVYNGIRTIRDYLQEATSTIDLHDNYIGQEIIDIIEPYASNQKLTIRITTKISKLKQHEKSDLKKFIQQYPNVSIKNSDEAHARFFIIDGGKIISSGASFKDLGKDLDMIGEITSNNSKKEINDNFRKWWKTGAPLS